MKHLVIFPEYTYAGYCSTGGNKDWAACLAVEKDDQDAGIPEVGETTEVVYLSIHGPHGGNLISDTPKKLIMKQAGAHFTKKCREKEGKAYDRVSFAQYLPAFGRPLGLHITQVAGEALRESSPSEVATVPTLHYQASIVKAAPFMKIQQLLAEGSDGVTEKVNGERFMYHQNCCLRANEETNGK